MVLLDLSLLIGASRSDLWSIQPRESTILENAHVVQVFTATTQQANHWFEVSLAFTRSIDSFDPGALRTTAQAAKRVSIDDVYSCTFFTGLSSIATQLSIPPEPRRF